MRGLMETTYQDMVWEHVYLANRAIDRFETIEAGYHIDYAYEAIDMAIMHDDLPHHEEHIMVAALNEARARY